MTRFFYGHFYQRNCPIRHFEISELSDINIKIKDYGSKRT